MRIGVAGVGRIGTMHATNLSGLDEIDEVLLFDPVPGRAAQASATLPGTRSVDDLDALFTLSDGVLLATPTATHPAMLRAALAAGVPALCEKPIASDLDEMTALVRDVEASGVDVVVGFQRRFDPAVSELHRRVRAGEVGDVYLVRALGNDAEPPDPSYLPQSGGIFRDLLIHDLDAVPWLVGEPVVEVYASGSVLVDDAFARADDVDNAVVLLKFAGGAHATLSGGRHDPLGYDHRIEVLGSRDSLVAGLDPRTPLTSLEPGGPKSAPDAYSGFPERFHRAYLAEVLAFTKVIAGTVANPSPARESLISLRLAEACERSRRSGAPVRVRTEVTGVKIAGAPISWGVCEVPGWGRVLDPATVLAEMASLGLRATELGPPDYLPADPDALKARLDEHGLTLVGGFLAVPLHTGDQAAVDEADRVAALLARAGAEVLVLAAATGLDGYDERPELTDDQWRTLVGTAARIRDQAARHGLRTVLHPHVGTHVERAAEVERFLADSDLQLWLDTGHLLIGGTDPVDLARRHPHRIGHVHLKDVRADIAATVRTGDLGYTAAVHQRMYVPLGDGDVDVAALVAVLRDAGYTGWYVLEQDTALGDDSPSDTPVRDTARTLAHLDRLTA